MYLKKKVGQGEIVTVAEVTKTLKKKKVERRIRNGDWDTDTDCVNSVNQGPC
jgi:hypothetical protein